MDSFEIVMNYRLAAAIHGDPDVQTPIGVIIAPTTLTPEETQQIRDQWATYHQGLPHSGIQYWPVDDEDEPDDPVIVEG